MTRFLAPRFPIVCLITRMFSVLANAQDSAGVLRAVRAAVEGENKVRRASCPLCTREESVLLVSQHASIEAMCLLHLNVVARVCVVCFAGVRGVGHASLRGARWFHRARIDRIALRVCCPTFARDVVSSCRTPTDAQELQHADFAAYMERGVIAEMGTGEQILKGIKRRQYRARTNAREA